MANRYFQQFQGTLEKGVVKLFAKVTFSSGTATVARGKGITSITKNGTGTYDIVLNDKYQRLLGASIVFKDASAVPLTCFNYVSAEAVASGTMSVKFANASKSATDPADTSTLYLELTLGNSSAL